MATTVNSSLACAIKVISSRKLTPIARYPDSRGPFAGSVTQDCNDELRPNGEALCEQAHSMPLKPTNRDGSVFLVSF